MRNVAILILAVGSVFIVSCGTNLSGSVTLAQARSTCVEADGTVDANSVFESLVILAELSRDQGLTPLEFIGVVLDSCGDVNENQCAACFTQIASVVWP